MCNKSINEEGRLIRNRILSEVLAVRANIPVDQLTPTSLNTAARLQKESYSLSDASPSIRFFDFQHAAIT